MNTEQNRISAISNELAAMIERHNQGQAMQETAIEGLAFYRQTEPADSCSLCVVEPSIALVVQGAKSMTLGDQEFRYDPYHFLITSLDLPARMQVLEANDQAPYLGLVLKFDLAVMSELIVQAPLQKAPPASMTRAWYWGL